MGTPADNRFYREKPHPSDEIARLREALALAEDVLSRWPFSTEIWPNGLHPQEGIAKIRAALKSE